MRSLSLRSGNSPNPLRWSCQWASESGFPPPCHTTTTGGSYPAGLSPAGRAGLCWTHVGSRTGAPTVGSGGKSNHCVGPQSGYRHVSSPRLLKRSKDALRFPAWTSWVMRPKPSPSRISFASGRTLRSAPFSSRGCLPCRKVVTDSRATIPPKTRLHRYCAARGVRHPLAFSRFPGAAG